jgi:hypothetical protein
MFDDAIEGYRFYGVEIVQYREHFRALPWSDIFDRWNAVVFLVPVFTRSSASSSAANSSNH